MFPGALNLDPVDYRDADLPADKDANLVFYCSNSMCRKAPNAARRAKEDRAIATWRSCRPASAAGSPPDFRPKARPEPLLGGGAFDGRSAQEGKRVLPQKRHEVIPKHLVTGVPRVAEGGGAGVVPGATEGAQARLLQIRSEGPVVPSRIRSEGPARRNAATGKPEAMASRMTFPKVSRGTGTRSSRHSHSGRPLVAKAISEPDRFRESALEFVAHGPSPTTTLVPGRRRVRKSGRLFSTATRPT